MKRILHRTEKEIIRVLFHEGRPLSVHELSELSGMSWVTARKYLALCLKKGIVSKQDTAKRSYYAISKELLRELYKYMENRNEDR